MPLDENFLRVARTKFNPHCRSSGTEHVAMLLYSLVRMARARRIVEYGSGYTTLFMLAALADNAHDADEERAALIAKTAEAGAVEDLGPPWDVPRVKQWFNGGGKACTVDPAYYLESYDPHLFSIDAIDGSHEYAQRMRDAVRELKLEGLLTHLTGSKPAIDLLPPHAFPIDLAWNDDRGYREFFELYWPQLNPQGGLMIFHNTTAMVHSWGDIQWMKEMRAAEGDLEILTMREPHKLVQNSCTILRRTTAFQPRFLSPTTASPIFEALREFRKTEPSLSLAPDLQHAGKA